MAPVTTADVDVFRNQLEDLNTLMIRDINAAFRRTSHLDTDTQQRWMTDAYPEIWTPYGAASGELAATWYQGLAPDLVFTAVEVLLPPRTSIAGQVAWAFAQHAITHALLGAAQRDMWNEARRTVTTNVDKEHGAKWARHASANACRWCQMLSTRGPVYSSKNAASVDGDGPRLFKEKYHKHCHCLAVPVRPGKSYEPPPYVDEWTADYEKAARQAGVTTGSRNVKAVMAAYREMDK